MSIEANVSSGVAKFAREKAYVRRGFWAKARRVAAGLPFAEDLVAAYFCAFDRETPRHVQAALIGALAYLLLAVAQPVLVGRFGVFVRLSMLRGTDLIILVAIVVAALGIGAIPAWRAYRHSLADGLTIRMSRPYACR